jgi:bis(5'-nucleosidyl)-tetraphosphatase
MKYIQSAGIITYIIKDQKPLYLLLHHTAGHWDFPKGTMEAGESKEETALRELSEETGLTVDLDTGFEEKSEYEYMHYQWGLIPKTVYYFVGKAHAEEVVLSDEHTDYLWLSYDDALKTITHQNSQDILKKAHTYII